MPEVFSPKSSPVLPNLAHLPTSDSKSGDSNGSGGRAPKASEAPALYTQTMQKMMAGVPPRFLADAVTEQILVVGEMLSAKNTHSRLKGVVCALAAVVIAVLPTLVRLGRTGHPFRFFPDESIETNAAMRWNGYLVIVCYAFSAFFFAFVHIFYTYQAVAVFKARRMHMLGLSSMLDDAATSKKRVFPLRLPTLDFARSSHIIAWSKMRVFLLQMKVKRMFKFQVHEAILFVPLAVLAIVVIVTDLNKVRACRGFSIMIL
jgi:hypothetical protein